MICIAIPDSSFVDEDSLRGKTIKSGYIARAASVFGVERIYIYRDPSGNFDRDYDIARAVLEYAETPQYLRKRLVRKRSDLEFVGLLPPLKIPHHQKSPEIALREIREAALVEQNNQLMADVGARELADFEGKGQAGKRVTVEVSSISPLKVESSSKPHTVYWGYEVRRAPTLGRFLRGADFDFIILTSRLGKPLNQFLHEFEEKVKGAKKVIVCFGSPDKGIPELFKLEHASEADLRNALMINAFPHQNTETVRLEEAIFGFLGILNLSIQP